MKSYKQFTVGELVALEDHSGTDVAPETHGVLSKKLTDDEE